MILPILNYGHPVLRKKGAPVGEVTPEVRQFVSDMLDTMYDAHGIGLAAQQVGRAERIAVLDVRGVEDRPSTLFLNDEPADVDAFMPVVLIDPEIRLKGEVVSGPEGCLSFPEIYGDIPRSEEVEVEATDLEGRRFQFRCGGLLARAVQHEVDHLNGVLFIDRMPKSAKSELKPDLETLMAETKAALAEQGAGA